MKTRFFAFYTLSAFAALSIGVLSAVAGQRGGLLPMLASADESYTLVLNQNKNVLTDGTASGTFVTEKGTVLSVEYQQYMSSSESWGRLGPSGYIQNAHGEGGRIGGLISISYEITRALTIDYGFDAYPGKEFCRTATLSRAESTFSFGDEKPDRFRISSSGDWSSIISMTFTYSCSPTDSHTHEYTSGKVGRVGSTGNYEYKHTCDICGEAEGSVVNFDEYAVKIGTNSGDVLEYNPYNFDKYTGVGSLDFDPNATRFVLNLSGDNSSSDVYIDCNTTHAPSGKANITVNSAANTSIRNITQVGGNSSIIFSGNELTFNQGSLSSQAMYTSVKAPLNFSNVVASGDTRTLTAIDITNGRLVLESDVTIDKYVIGIYLRNAITEGGLTQSSGTLTITDTNLGIVSNYGSNDYKVSFKGNSNITGRAIAIQIEHDMLVEVVSGTHNWTGSEVTSEYNDPTVDVRKLHVGETNTNPILNINSYGRGIHAKGDTNGSHEFIFNSGTTTLADMKDSYTNVGFYNDATASFSVEAGATVNVKNYGHGFQDNDSDSKNVNVAINGTLNIEGCKYGITRCNVQVGGGESNGKLKINVNSSKSTSDSRAYGILVGDETINFKKGGAAIFSNSWEHTHGIEFANGLSNKFSVSEEFKFGFGNLGWAAKHGGGNPDGTDRSNVKGTCITFAIGDMTWGAYADKKLVSNESASSNEDLLNKVFG